MHTLSFSKNFNHTCNFIKTTSMKQLKNVNIVMLLLSQIEPLFFIAVIFTVFFVSSLLLTICLGHTLGFECNICGKKFTTRQYLNLHHRTHEVGDRFYCHCGQWYRNNQELTEHYSYCSKLTNKNSYSCDFCEQKFRFPRDKVSF